MPVRRVEPTHENAVAIQSLVLEDLVYQMGLPTYQARKEADPKNDELVNRQYDRLDRAIRNNNDDLYYAGFFDGDQLVAVSKRSEWLVGDDIPYRQLTKVSRPLARAASRLADDGIHLPGRPLGIFQLSADSILNQSDQDEVLSALLDDTTQYADVQQRIVRTQLLATVGITAYEAVLADKGFRRTSRVGRPIADVRQRLWERPLNLS